MQRQSVPIRMKPRQLLIAGQTTGHRYQHIIGARISIHRDHIKCRIGSRAQQGQQSFPINDRIRGHEAQHRGHIGMNHSRTFSRSGNCNFLAADPYLHAAFFFTRSVVKIAWQNSSAPAAPPSSFSGSPAIPLRTQSIFSSSPITPVEATATSCSFTPR